MQVHFDSRIVYFKLALCRAAAAANFGRLTSHSTYDERTQ